MTKSVNAAILRFPSLIMLAHGCTGPCNGSENSPCCRYQAAPIATGTKGLVRRRLSIVSSICSHSRCTHMPVVASFLDFSFN
ncbi:hypothetical protein BCR44DRAFT_1440631 [Catenaria anguillulae PL171]|uniref:Secreted protein n=1 Tax=Catenaria anguillulae PL171 TaxID=765915 RepID=A0A1Y2HCN1_9FUNG|nr:hypothetical protein BCR44DRAFT_1440631 [Catenaria anguillulae PL171]